MSAPKWVEGVPCSDAKRGIESPGHGACYREYRETKTTDGQTLPAMRCPCSCHEWTDETAGNN